jgi:hypothetical protein
VCSFPLPSLSLSCAFKFSLHPAHSALTFVKLLSTTPVTIILPSFLGTRISGTTVHGASESVKIAHSPSCGRNLSDTVTSMLDGFIIPTEVRKPLFPDPDWSISRILTFALPSSPKMAVTTARSQSPPYLSSRVSPASPHGRALTLFFDLQDLTLDSRSMYLSTQGRTLTI